MHLDRPKRRGHPLATAKCSGLSSSPFLWCDRGGDGMRRCDPRKVLNVVPKKNIVSFRQLVTGALCGLLSACVGTYGLGPFGAGDLQSARAACNQAYPP